MCRFLRYCVSHCLHAAMTRLEEVNSEVSVWSPLRWLGYVSGLNLLAALCLGLWTRWQSGSAETLLPLVFLLVPLVLGVACASYYYLHMEWLSQRLLVHPALGFLLGLLCFLDSLALRQDPKERAASYLLLTSAAMRTLWALLDRLLGCSRYRPAFLTSAERLELAGFAAASAVTMLPQDSLSVAVLLAALAAVMVALRMRALLALPNLLCFSVVAAVLFFRSVGVPTNPAALACFFSQLLCDPLLDFFFSGLSVTERWRPFLARSAPWRRLSLLPVLAVEAAFVALAARKLLEPHRWWLPLVAAVVLCALFWAICHLVFLMTVWGFHSKLSACQRVLAAQLSGSSGLDKVMASRGMRHLCLIWERLLFFTLVSTVVLATLCWQPSSSPFVSTVLLVLPLESLFHGLFHELGSSLGGTCVGYALVVPTNYCSPDGQPLLLPPDQVQELNQRSTAMLSSVQRLFAHHLIEAFGCDYSSSGVTLEALAAKIKTFLELRTADGPRHDTYLIYYSGHCHPSGEWALAGGDTLRLEQILDWWRDRNGSFSSRLLLVLDCQHVEPWVQQVRRVEGLYVAVQGAALRTPARHRVTVHDPEQQLLDHQDPPQLGDFTSRWVEFNCNLDGELQWCEERRQPVGATYGLSRHWSDYTLHLPSGSDLAHHWGAYFPRLAYPLVQLLLWCSSLHLLWLCSATLRCLRRVKLNWFPPAVLDTGQGLKLVRA